MAAPNYDREKTLKACVIAALSMMFHDPYARATLIDKGVPPIAFEDLPYAAVLMFADALQDDRRDIAASVFPADGVLESISVTSKKVIAKVCLPCISIAWWPSKIVEYQSVMHWINAASETKFIIDYQNGLGLPPK